jgi:3-phenylpropionate/trans-cinnamate dioxygenase ferredoxin reductase component
MSGPVVIIGAGQAGVQTALSLRDLGFTEQITLINGEDFLPYQRPPLSKAYLKSNVADESLWFRTEQLYLEKSIQLLQNTKVVNIDRHSKTVSLSTNRTLPYEYLVFATGSRNRPLSVEGSSKDNILQLRTLAEAKKLRLAFADKPKVVIIGGGFIGLEIASVAQATGSQTIVIEASSRVMNRSVSAKISSYLESKHRALGTEILVNDSVTSIIGTDKEATGVQTKNGRKISCDLVLVCIGIIPNITLATEAGLSVDNGILVNRTLCTSDPNIFAIGDCASFPSYATQQNIRLESVQNAVDHAKIVAANICNQAAEYTSAPWFWSDQAGVKLQIAGLTSSADETILKGEPESGKFSVCCFRDGRFIGTESINQPADHMASRKLLAMNRSFEIGDLSGPDITLKSLSKG